MDEEVWISGPGHLSNVQVVLKNVCLIDVGELVNRLGLISKWCTKFVFSIGPQE